MCSALGSDTLNVMGAEPPVWISTSPELRYQSNTSATPSLESATKPSSDMDMMATTCVIRLSSVSGVPSDHLLPSPRTASGRSDNHRRNVAGPSDRRSDDRSGRRVVGSPRIGRRGGAPPPPPQPQDTHPAAPR